MVFHDSTAPRCLCGGHVYTLDQLVAMSSAQDAEDYADMWRSLMDHYSLYCSNEDEILTEMEVWRVTGRKHPVHDEDWALGVNGDVWDGKGDPVEELIW